MIPPLIEIGEKLYFVMEWDIDQQPGDQFTLRRLSPEKERRAREWRAERDREIWARLVDDVKKEKH